METVLGKYERIIEALLTVMGTDKTIELKEMKINSYSIRNIEYALKNKNPDAQHQDVLVDCIKVSVEDYDEIKERRNYVCKLKMLTSVNENIQSVEVQLGNINFENLKDKRYNGNEVIIENVKIKMRPFGELYKCEMSDR